MIEMHVRPKMQPYFDKVGISLSYFCSPNLITFFAFTFGIAAGLFISLHQLIIGLFLLWISGLCDIFDGTVARIVHSTQKKGAYIDLISDRMVESAVILGLTIAYPQHYFAYIIFFISLLLHFSTFLAAGALFGNTGTKSMHYDKSFVERAEAFLVFSLMLVFPDYIFPILMAFNVLVFGSGVSRFYRVVTNS